MPVAFVPPSWLDTAEYPFTHHQIDLPDGRMHYVDEGAGEPVLFVHGTPSWSFEFRTLIKALAPARRVIVPDHLGFGLSSRPRQFPYTPEAHARVLHTFVERLGLQRFTLVVHDFGGPIGLPLALNGQFEIPKLILMNTWMWPIDDDARLARGAKLLGGGLGRFLYKYANASLRLIMPSAYGDRAKLTASIHRQYLEPFRSRDDRVLVLHALARSLLASREFYADLWRRSSALEAIPTLIVWGLKDSAFGPPVLARWQKRLPHARVVALPDAGHWPHEEAPDEVAGAVRAFLE